MRRLTMHACPADHAALPPLFSPALPNSPALWAVLEGRHPGQALVDDAVRPYHCVVRTGAALTYASRRIDRTFLANAIAHFRPMGPVWLVWPAELDAQVPAPEPDRRIQRFEFSNCEPGSPMLAGWREGLPPSCSVHPIDQRLLERCQWRAEIEFYTGSLQTFLSQEMGLCLLREDEILCEAYVSSHGGGRAEIGAVTRATDRGRGYAPILCAFLIQACGQHGWDAVWSCDAENQASVRVARKLGFRQERAYEILEYGQSLPPLQRAPS